MRKVMLMIILLLVNISSAQAFTPVFSEEPVVAVYGASYGSAKAADFSSFDGGSLNNGGYFDVSDGLTREGFIVLTEAQGGATTYNQYAQVISVDGIEVTMMSWRGIEEQVDRSFRTIPLWPDRITGAVFTGWNDCWHGTKCSPEDMDTVLYRIKDQVVRVRDAGIRTIVHGMPEWESLHLAEALYLYFGPGYYTISEEDYKLFQAKHRAILGTIPGIHYEEVWKKAGEFGDGLHPEPEDVKKACSIDAQILRKK